MLKRTAWGGKLPKCKHFTMSKEQLAMGVRGFREHPKATMSMITGNTASLMLLMAQMTAVHGNAKTPMSVN